MSFSPKANAKELMNKFRNPFLISFLFSWLIWNWEAVLYFLFYHDDVITKIETVKSEYFGFWVTFAIPFFLGGVLVLIVDAINELLDYLSHKWFTIPRLNRRVIEEDYSHDSILQKNKQANQKLNKLIEDILKKIDQSNSVKRKVIVHADNLRKNHSKLEEGNATYHKFVEEINNVLNSDLELLEFIYQDYGKNVNNFDLNSRSTISNSDYFESIENGVEKHTFDFKHIQF
jgi:hypothetical protein